MTDRVFCRLLLCGGKKRTCHVAGFSQFTILKRCKLVNYS